MTRACVVCVDPVVVAVAEHDLLRCPPFCGLGVTAAVRAAHLLEEASDRVALWLTP